jgi:hypothetical protein
VENPFTTLAPSIRLVSMLALLGCGADGTATGQHAQVTPRRAGTGEAGGATDHPLAASAYAYLGDYPSRVGHDWTQATQGAASDGTHWYIARRRRLYKVPITTSLDRELGGYPNVGFLWSGYDHMGDPDWFAGRLYIPLEGPSGRAVGVVDANLAPVAFYTLPHAHAAWVAVDPRDGLLYTAPQFDRVAELRVYQRDTGALEGVRPITDGHGRVVTLSRVQGGAFAPHGELYLVSDARGDGDRGGIWVVEVRADGGLVVTVQIPVTHAARRLPWPLSSVYVGDELEGLAILDLDGGAAPGIRGQLHLMMLDPGLVGGGDRICFKHFRTPSIALP